MDGIIVVRKERGYTSNDVVAKLRGILRMKKIGHTGTLDPEAEGVLPVCLGQATKLVDLIADVDKEYRAVLRLGIVTDTQDLASNASVLSELSPEEVREKVTREDALRAVRSFEGEYDQVPPMYSAIKQDGRKLYELAREGRVVERRARRVEIFGIEPEKIDLPELTILVRCSKGTYIRTLCSDIGERLGVGGAMASLVRTRVGSFALGDALTLGEIGNLARTRDGTRTEEVLWDRLPVRPLESFFADCPALSAKEEADRLLKNGNPLKKENLSGDFSPAGDKRVRMCDSTGKFCGLYRYQPEKGMFFPEKMFLGI
ncbi:MAG: tRNA pseudouridine(55) synthase TruB [Lachnospiraceae bacterium]|nr:tRNA pseudouridine(55) synthase TruB [Lachnospiraceae bacterium]